MPHIVPRPSLFFAAYNSTAKITVFLLTAKKEETLFYASPIISCRISALMLGRFNVCRFS